MTLQGLHRFTRPGPDGRTLPDTAYADLSLAMRAGDDPGKVFDTLLARGQIRLHPDPETLREALATTAAAPSSTDGERIAVVADTREQVAELNTAIRDRLVAAGRVDDVHAVVTAAGERIGVGDRVATRRNDRHLDVANRDTWLVTAVGRRGGLLVTPVTPVTGDMPGDVTPDRVRARVLPADYVTAHVQLAYASTAHGVQGETVIAAHVVVGEHTGAASAYVGMTRGRQANTAHLVAADVVDAGERWLAVFARDRADLGPAHAAQQAAAEAARYAQPRPLEEVLAELHAAWTAEQRCLDRLAAWEPQRDTLREVVALEAPLASGLAGLQAARDQAAAAAEQAQRRAEASDAAVTAHADQLRDALFAPWDGERDAARQAGRAVLDGPGRLGLRRGAVARAGQQLTAWSYGWRPHLPDLPCDSKELARVADRFDDRPALWRAFDNSAHGAAEQAHPEHGQLHAAADAAQRAHEQARSALTEARRQGDERLHRFGPIACTPDPGGRLAELERDLAADRRELTDIRAHVTRLMAEPSLLTQSGDRLDREREAWRAGREAEQAARRAGTTSPTRRTPAVRVPPPPPQSLGLRTPPGRVVPR